MAVHPTQRKVLLLHKPDRIPRPTGLTHKLLLLLDPLIPPAIPPNHDPLFLLQHKLQPLRMPIHNQIPKPIHKYALASQFGFFCRSESLHSDANSDVLEVAAEGDLVEGVVFDFGL